jgi:uncharacterized RDD family membrane protein YckC
MTSTLEPLPTSPVQVSAECRRHPGQRVLETCLRCGDYVCLECVQYEGGHAYCAKCAPVELPLAELSSRFLGRLVDHLLYAAATFVPGGIVWAAGAQGAALVVGAVSFLSLWGYNIHLLATSGQSLGKRFLGTRIVTDGAGPVRVVRTVVLRTLLPFWFGAIPGAGSLFSLVDAVFIFGQRRRCVHDLMASTMVVEAAATEHVYAPRGA